MPPSTRSGGKAPPSRIYHATPTLKQVQFPARRRVVKSYSAKKASSHHDELPDSEGELEDEIEANEEDKENGSAAITTTTPTTTTSRKPTRAKRKQREGLRDPKQKTLTQIDFVSSSSLSDIPSYAFSESEPPTPQKPVAGGKGKKKTTTAAKSTTAKRRRTLGDEAEEAADEPDGKGKPKAKGKSKGKGKRRKTMGDTPAGWHTQTVTQFYPRDVVVQDSEDDEGFDDWLAESPSKPESSATATKKAGSSSSRKADLAEYDGSPSRPPRQHASTVKTQKVTWTEDPSASAANDRGPETPTKKGSLEIPSSSRASTPLSIKLLSRYGGADDKPTPSRSSGVIRYDELPGVAKVGKIVIEDSFATASWDSPSRPVVTPLKDITEDVIGEMASPSRGRGRRRTAASTHDDGRESNKENESVRSEKDNESDMGIMMEIPDSDEEEDFSEGDDTIVPGLHQAEAGAHREEMPETTEGIHEASAGSAHDEAISHCEQEHATRQEPGGQRLASPAVKVQTSVKEADGFERTSSEVVEVSQPLVADISQPLIEEPRKEESNLEYLSESTSELSSAPPTEELELAQEQRTSIAQSSSEAPRKTPMKPQVAIDDNPVEIAQPLDVNDSDANEDETADNSNYNAGLETQHALHELASSTDDFAKSQSSREPASTGQQPQHSTPPTEQSFKTPTRRLRKPLGALLTDSLTQQPLESQRIPRNIIQTLVGEPDTTTDILIPIPDTQLAALVSGHSLHVSFPFKVPVTVQRLWFFSNNLLRYGGIAHPQDEIISATGEKQWRYHISQVVELNNPHDEDSLRREEWIWGPIGRYQYFQPGPIQSILANLQRALFRDDGIEEASEDEDEDEDGHEQPTQQAMPPPVSSPPPTGSRPKSTNSSFSISQQVEAQLRSDIATRTEQSPAGGGGGAASAAAPPVEEDDVLVPSTPLKRRAQQPQQHLGANDNTMRPSQATTASQASTPSQTPQRAARAARTVRPAVPTLRRPVTHSSSSTVMFPDLSSPPYLMTMSSVGEDGSLLLGSSQLLTRSQMLPESLIREDDRPPPVIWDSDGEQA